MKKADITPEVARKVRLAGGYDQDPARYDERVPRNGSVIRAKIAANAVGGSELSGSTTDDSLRAVGGPHAKTNFLVKRHVPLNLIDSDLLSGSATDDGLRAVTSSHQKSNSATDRVLSGSATDDALRAVTTTHAKTNFLVKRHVPANLIDSDLLSGSATDDNQRAVGGAHLKTNVLVKRHVPTNLIDSDLLSASTGDDTLRAVGGAHIKTGAIATRHVVTNSITQVELSQSATDNALRAVSNPHLKSNSVDGRVISGHSSDDSSRSVGLNHVRAELRNAAQNTLSLRFISGLLGGDATAAASGNHSHSSGNAMNFDRIPDDDQRRILAYRSQVIDDLARVEMMTLLQLRTFVHNLSVVALSALSFNVDAPDIDADERRARKDAGENILPGWEYRASIARREAGLPDESSPDMDGLLFQNQKHYSGEPPRSIRPPGLRPTPPRPFQ